MGWASAFRILQETDCARLIEICRFSQQLGVPAVELDEWKQHCHLQSTDGTYASLVPLPPLIRDHSSTLPDVSGCDLSAASRAATPKRAFDGDTAVVSGISPAKNNRLPTPSLKTGLDAVQFFQASLSSNPRKRKTPSVTNSRAPTPNLIFSQNSPTNLMFDSTLASNVQDSDFLELNVTLLP